jgi:hypothetical protein
MQYPAPTASETSTGIGLGCVALLMLGLQPLLLGALLQEHRLTVEQLTLAATLELLLLGATAGLMGAFVPHQKLRLIAALGGLILVVSNAACLISNGLALVAGRAAAGLGGGILVWLAVALITHGRAPARLSGIFLAGQTAAQAVIAALLPITFMPAHGANGGFAVLAVISALSIGTISFLPASLPELPKDDQAGGGFNLAGWLGLASAFLFMAGIVGTWVFIDPVAVLAGITPAIAQYTVAVALAAQVAGALVATLVAHRLPAGITLVASCVGCILSLAVMAGRPGDVAFMAAIIVFGFLWLFTLPCEIPLLFRADSTRRAAMLLAGAQLLGGAAGPQVTGLFATETALKPALAAAAALFVLSAGAVLVALAMIRKQFFFEKKNQKTFTN